MMPGSKGHKAVVLAQYGLCAFEPHKHEEVAIYTVNERIPNVCRIVEIA